MSKFKIYDPKLKNKVGEIVEKLGWLRNLFISKGRSDDYFVLKLEAEMLQISKHLVFMLELIRRERQSRGIYLPDEKKPEEE